ncbi:inhibin alpha chain [Phascolarctos cinereus]|uniref:Inhibin alpha chain n=1 Tax=Phascolarctos cinereus TaxID=38626 RepID=A0A6P5LR79_PHACI|nr:inhibin alpha chain [Phascolarctos cinereus]
MRPPAMPPLLLVLQLLLLMGMKGGHGCQGPEPARELVLAKVRAVVLDALGAPNASKDGGEPGARRLPRRHAHAGGPTRRSVENEDEDLSQVILFPTSGPGCEDEPETGEAEGLFTYTFRPSLHTRSRQVTAAQLWFHTGLDRGGAKVHNDSGPTMTLLAMSSGGPTAVPILLGPAPPHWAVLHLAAPAFTLLTRPLLVLLLHCPNCPCLARLDATPFLVAHTRARPPSVGERARRSPLPPPWPWSPAALRLLQRPSEDPAAHADCHRAALNISFQELGWDQWIVHPSSFIFHYCHGGCGLVPSPVLSPGASLMPSQPLPLGPGSRPCCAALPSTMRPLRVRTTSDGGYSFKYETVPNLLTQHCACI